MPQLRNRKNNIMWAVFQHQRTRNNYPCGHDWNWYNAGYNPSNHLFGRCFPFYLVEALTTQNKKRLCTDDRFTGKIVIEIILWVKFQTGKTMWKKRRETCIAEKVKARAIMVLLWLFVKASLLERLITRKFLPSGTKYLRVFVIFAFFSSDP